MVLAHACYDDYDDGQEAIPGAERSLAPEGSPLLANLGRASASGYLLDLSVSTLAILYSVPPRRPAEPVLLLTVRSVHAQMMAQLNAKERTLWEIAALAREAGWKVTGTTRAAGSLWAYTSAKPI